MLELKLVYINKMVQIVKSVLSPRYKITQEFIG